MDRHRDPRPQLTTRFLTISHLATLVATRGPLIEAAMASVAADGFGGGLEGGSNEDTTVEAAVLAREVVMRDWVDLVDQLDRIIASANRVLNIGDFWLKAEGAAAPEDRCDGAGDQPWGDPTCERMAVKRVNHQGRSYELCWACIKRKQRYRGAEVA